jgi:glutathione S-transferase
MNSVPMHVYDDPLSSECYTIRLFLSYQQQRFERDYSRLDPLRHQQRQAELIIAGQRLLGIGACLHYLAGHCPLNNPLAELKAEVFNQWLQFQHLLQQSIGVLRQAHLGFDVFLELQTQLECSSYQQLKQLNDHLCRQSVLAEPWLHSGDAPSLADFLVFPLVALSSDAGLSLDDFIHIRRWLQRVRNIHGFIAMPGMLCH